MPQPSASTITLPNPSQRELRMNASVTVVVPTYREAANIPHLIARLQAVRESSGIDLELLLMDDDSQDGSDRLVDSLALPWVTLVTRKTDRGLSLQEPEHASRRVRSPFLDQSAVTRIVSIGSGAQRDVPT